MELIEIKRSSLRDFLHVLFKRQHQILLFFFITVATVAVGTFMAKPVYEAKAQILVKIGRQNLYIPPNSTSGQVINFNRDNQVNSEIELLKSRSLSEKVVKSLGHENIYKDIDHKDAVLKFQNSLSVDGIKKSDVIVVSFKHKDPEIAAKIVNTLANAYLVEHLLVHKNLHSYNFFEDQSQVLKTRLEQSEAALETFKKQNGVTALDEQQRLILNHISNLRAEMDRTLTQEAETENRILQIRQQFEKTPETISQGEEVDHNPFLISSLEARFVELQLKEKELLLKYEPQNRLVENVREEIEMVQSRLAEKETKRYGKSRVGLNTTYQRLEEDLFRNQAESKALTAKKEIQITQFAENQVRLENLNQVEVELNQLQQAVDVNRQNYRLYLAKFEESRISDAMDNKKMTNVSLMEAALPPMKPVSPKVFLNILVSIFMGLFGGLGLAFFTEYLDDSLEKPENVEEALQLPVLVSVSKLKSDLTWGGFTDTETPVDTRPPVQVTPWRRSLPWTTALILTVILFVTVGFHLKKPGSYSPGAADSFDTVKSHAVPILPSLGITDSTQPGKSDPPKHEIVAHMTEAATQPVTADKSESSPIHPNPDDFPMDPAAHQKTEAIIDPSTDDKLMGHATNHATDEFQAFPKTPAPGNAIASETKLVSRLSEKETVSNPSTQQKIVKPTGSIDIGAPVTVSAVPFERDIKSRQVKVQSGENLYRIILKNYGTYDDGILAQVLAENPEITDLSRIRAGQIITLPVFDVQIVD